MIVYSYIISNDETYDYDEFELLSFDKISEEEFKAIVSKAVELCGPRSYYTPVARKILELDDRFFLPVRTMNACVDSTHDSCDFNCEGCNDCDNRLIGIYKCGD